MNVRCQSNCEKRDDFTYSGDRIGAICTICLQKLQSNKEFNHVDL